MSFRLVSDLLPTQVPGRNRHRRMGGVSRRQPAYRRWLVGVLATLVWPLSAGADDLAGRLGSVLSNLPDPQVACSALIVDLDAHRTVYARQADTPLVPASNQKLLVMAAAVDRLGDTPDLFRTVLGLRGEDLVLIGAGDPCLGDEVVCDGHGVSRTAFLDLWAHALRSSGRFALSGAFIVDASVLDEALVHPDWDAGDLVKWYGAPVGGVNFNNNCVELTAWPGPPGTPAEWSLFPPCPAATVINNCRSVVGNETPLVGRRAGTFELVLSGKVSNRVTLQSISVPDPSAFVASAFRAHLTSRGVTIAGPTRYEAVARSASGLPGNLEIIGQHVTPLPDVLGRIGINSQNMCAEALCKRLGYEHTGRTTPGSWETGRQAIAAYLDSVGCARDGMVIADGSGLSRTNRVSAVQFVHVLRHMHEHPRRDLFRNSLAGTETGGTLKRRMRNIDGEVYAKTGYIRGVRTLSGYVRARSGRWFAFSVLFNGFQGSSAPYNRIHNEICRILASADGETDR